MLRRFTKKRVIVVLGVVAALVVAGAAVAYFTITGTGTGHASVGSATNWTISADAATGTMFPGSGTSTINYTVTNPATQSQHLTSTSAAVADDSGSPANILDHGTAIDGCLASWFTPTNTPPAAGDVAGGDSVTGSVSVTMSAENVSQDACQGHTPDITISAN